MDERDLARVRAARQRLRGVPFADPTDVVRAFGAMQAQEFLPAKWALAQRACGPAGERVDDTTVESRFAEGTILRTHVLRPTWHFVHRDDLRWLLVASAARVHQVNSSYYRKTGVEGATVGRTQDVLRAELADGARRTRAELGAALAAAGLPGSGVPLAYVLIRAELDGVVVSGPRRGRAHTYALMDDRVPIGADVEPDEALAELTRRYLSTRGPASLKDYMAWASLTAKLAQRGLDLLGDQVERTAWGDVTLFDAELPPAGALSPTGAPTHPPGGGAVDLIQGYDEYVMGYLQTRVVPISIEPRGGPPPFLHTILLDGQLLGRWRFTATAREVVVETQVPGGLSGRAEAALDAEVRRFGEFLGLPARRAEPATHP